MNGLVERPHGALAALRPLAVSHPVIAADAQQFRLDEASEVDLRLGIGLLLGDKTPVGDAEGFVRPHFADLDAARRRLPPRQTGQKPAFRRGQSRSCRWLRIGDGVPIQGGASQPGTERRDEGEPEMLQTPAPVVVRRGRCTNRARHASA